MFLHSTDIYFTDYLYHLHTIFHAKQCPTDGIKNVYAFLKRSENLTR